MGQTAYMQLAIGWTCVSLFVITAVAVALDLLGLRDLRAHVRTTLHTALLLEIVVLGVGSFADIIRIDPWPVLQIPGLRAELVELQDANPGKKVDLCGETDRCEGSTAIGCVLAGDDIDTAGQRGQLVRREPSFREGWSNEPCGTSGRGWTIDGGSCGSGPPPSGTSFGNSGLKRCYFAVVLK
jgi:hypothetical protein